MAFHAPTYAASSRAIAAWYASILAGLTIMKYLSGNGAYRYASMVMVREERYVRPGACEVVLNGDPALAAAVAVAVVTKASD